MKKANKRWLGFIFGVLLPAIGIFGINQYQFPQLSFSAFIEHGWEVKAIGTWLRVAVLLDLLPFMFFLNSNQLKAAQGVFFGVLFYAAVIIYIIIAS